MDNLESNFLESKLFPYHKINMFSENLLNFILKKENLHLLETHGIGQSNTITRNNSNINQEQFKVIKS